MLTWVITGFALWLLGLGFVLALMRMSGDEDRAARQNEKRMYPFSDVPITQYGIGG